MPVVVLVLGLGVFAFHALSLGDAPSALDRALLELGDSLRSTASARVATLLTHLGSFVAVCSAVVAAACVLLARERPLEAAAVVGSFLLAWATVDVVKEVIGRPRPTGGLVVTSNPSFPSGHAAYSTAYVAVALLLGRPGARWGLVAAAACLAAVIGLTRIFLRVHYWSDVAAGWGLGSAIFAAGAIPALLVLRRSGRA
jgi:undecaprenyl-diphosphatase